MRLLLDIGQCERSAKRGAHVGSCLATVADAGGHAALLACAEGVAERPDAARAAKSATAALEDIYQSAADARSPRETLQEGLGAADRAVRGTGERGRAAAVAALVLHGRHWYAGHAGHVRV